MYVVTLVRDGPYRLYFYSEEGDEQPHIHIDRDTVSAKFTLNPVALTANHGFAIAEIDQVESLVERHAALLLEAWHERFGCTSC